MAVTGVLFLQSQLTLFLLVLFYKHNLGKLMNHFICALILKREGGSREKESKRESLKERDTNRKKQRQKISVVCVCVCVSRGKSVERSPLRYNQKEKRITIRKEDLFVRMKKSMLLTKKKVPKKVITVHVFLLK